MDATSQPPAEPIIETGFKRRWEDFATADRLPADPDAHVDPFTVAQLRRFAMMFFGHGAAHGDVVRARFEALIGADEIGHQLKELYNALANPPRRPVPPATHRFRDGEAGPR